MKAITTKYISATNCKGARIKAFDLDNNQVTIPYPYNLDVKAGHEKAMKLLLDKMDWHGELIGGVTKDGYAWVFKE